MPDSEIRERFGCGERHLRKIRNAARSGQLREKAMQLGVDLPEGYVDEPKAINGVPSARPLTHAIRA